MNNDDNDEEDDDDDDVEIGLHVVEDSTDDAKLQRLSTAEKEEAAQVQPETDRRPGTTAWQTCLAMATNYVRLGKNTWYVVGRLEQPRQDIFSCTCTTSPTNQPRNDNFYTYFLRLHLPQFEQSRRGHTSLVSLVHRHSCNPFLGGYRYR